LGPPLCRRRRRRRPTKMHFGAKQQALAHHLGAGVETAISHRLHHRRRRPAMRASASRLLVGEELHLAVGAGVAGASRFRLLHHRPATKAPAWRLLAREAGAWIDPVAMAVRQLAAEARPLLDEEEATGPQVNRQWIPRQSSSLHRPATMAPAAQEVVSWSVRKAPSWQRAPRKQSQEGSPLPRSVQSAPPTK